MWIIYLQQIKVYIVYGVNNLHTGLKNKLGLTRLGGAVFISNIIDLFTNVLKAILGI